MKITYHRQGNGPPVLLIHGVGGAASHWGPISEALGASHDVIAMDLRGHGGSDLIAGPLDAYEMARDALQVLDECDVARCAVVGLALGGAVAMALALDYPERVARLAVIGTVCGRTAEEKRRALDRVAFLKTHGLAALADSNRERWFTDAFRQEHPDVVERRVAQVKTCDPASYLHAFTVFCTADFADRLAEIGVPTLVVTGEHDLAATPRMAKLMAEGIGDCRMHVLPGLRHSVLIEAPAQVGALLEAFL